MCCIPLIFTRPFQSIHLSLGNIAHTCLYASLYPLLHCATLITVTLNKAKRSLFPLFCLSESDKPIVDVLVLSCAWRRLPACIARATIGSFLSVPLSL